MHKIMLMVEKKFHSYAKVQEIKKHYNHMGQVGILGQLATLMSSFSHPGVGIVTPLIECCFNVNLRLLYRTVQCRSPF